MATLGPEPSLDETEPTPKQLPVSEADTVFDALASTTAREILTVLHEEPATASMLARSVDTSIQNVAHHLENLAAADLVGTVDECYSVKGRKMDVYAPRADPLVLVSDESDVRLQIEG